MTGNTTSVAISHHITCTGKVVVEQAFQGHPADRTVLIIPQTVVVHRKQISSEGIVCNLHLHVVVNAARTGTRERQVGLIRLTTEFQKKKCCAGSETLTHSSEWRDLYVWPPCEPGSSFHKQFGWPCTPGPVERWPERKWECQSKKNDPRKEREEKQNRIGSLELNWCNFAVVKCVISVQVLVSFELGQRWEETHTKSISFFTFDSKTVELKSLFKSTGTVWKKVISNNILWLIKPQSFKVAWLFCSALLPSPMKLNANVKVSFINKHH